MRSALFILLFAIAGCAKTPAIHDIHLHNLEETEVRIEPAKNQLTVIYFLSPECPLCINYSLALREIAAEFSNDSVAFFGVHASKWFTAEEVEEYQLKYGLDFPMLLDDGNKLAKVLGATVTPEVFVLNSKSQVLYSGKIDDWVNGLGKKKLEVSDHYLKNTLEAWRDGKTIEATRTEPIGCLIE